MKVYVDENDIKRKIVTYHDGTNTQQGLYVYGKDKIEVLSLTDYTKQVKKEVCEDINELLKPYCGEEINAYVMEKVLDQIQNNEGE